MITRVYIMKNRANKDGSYSVYVRVTHKGHRFLVTTGLTTFGELEEYSFPKTESNARVKTNRLKQIVLQIESICFENGNLPWVAVRDKINESILGREPKPKTTLADYVEEFAYTKKGGTRGLYESTCRKVKDYDGKADINNVTHKWLRGFDAMLAKTMGINAKAIHLRNLRAVFNYAIDNGYTSNYPFRAFKIEHEATRKRSLSLEDVRMLKDYECEPFQREYRDMFMLMLYLIGINAADLFRLPHSALVGDRIEYRRAKTHKLYSVKVEPEAMGIIERYKGCKYLLNPLDRYKDYRNYLHHMNDALKSIGKEYRPGRKTTGGSLFDGLSSYWSRHTWATIAYNAGVQLDTISLALGHSMGKGALVTEIYIKPSLELVDKANRKVIDLINQNKA